MDGFWAFEMERRGAAEVVATDVRDRNEHDSPTVHPRRRSPPISGAPFAVAAERRGSQVSYRDVSVYDLRAEDIGTFDLVFAGYVLQMLRDPLRALDALHGVCRGSLIVLDTVSLPLELLPAPLARLNARRGQLEWFVFNRRGLRQAMTMMGFSVDAVTSVLRDHSGPAVTRQGLSLRTRLRHATGVLGRSAAVRGRA